MVVLFVCLVCLHLVDKKQVKSIGESMALHSCLPRSTELWLLIEMRGVTVLVLVLFVRLLFRSVCSWLFVLFVSSLV